MENKIEVIQVLSFSPEEQKVWDGRDCFHCAAHLFCFKSELLEMEKTMED
jgi:hypothetical protein